MCKMRTALLVKGWHSSSGTRFPKCCQVEKAESRMFYQLFDIFYAIKSLGFCYFTSKVLLLTLTLESVAPVVESSETELSDNVFTHNHQRNVTNVWSGVLWLNRAHRRHDSKSTALFTRLYSS